MKEQELLMGPGLKLPRSAVTETVAFLGKRGSGKTNAAGDLAEELYAVGAQFVVVDPVGIWWGLRTLADGKGPGLLIHVFGGRHGDLPLLPETGRIVARVVVEKGISAVLDLSGMRKGERKRFVFDFAEELFELKKEKRTPLHLFCEEAQNWMPQQFPKGEPDVARLLGTFEDIIQQGRNFGLGVSLISQRPQSINKSVLNQTEALFCFQMNGRSDRKAIADWVEEQDINDDGGLIQRLPRLRPGEAVLWSPGWLKRLEVVQLRMKRTYHAGATPRLGERQAAPARLAAIDVVELQALFAETVAKAKETDPKALRQRVATLERELAGAKRAPPAAPAAPAPVKPDPALVRAAKDLRTAIERLDLDEVQMRRAVASALVLVAELEVKVAGPRLQLGGHKVTLPSGTLDLGTGQVSPPSPRPAPKVKATLEKGEIGGGMVDMLRALAVRGHPHPRGGPPGLSKRALGALSWLKPGGSTFRTYLPKLNRLGMVMFDGNVVRISDVGRAQLEEARDLSQDEIVEGWRRKLPGGAMRMLDYLLLHGHHGLESNAIAGVELAKAADILPGGSTFRTYLPLLIRNGLVERSTSDRNMVLADREVF